MGAILFVIRRGRGGVWTLGPAPRSLTRMAKATEAGEDEAKRAGGHPAPGEKTKACGNCTAENNHAASFCFACGVPFGAGGKVKKPRAKKSKKKS